MDQRTTPGGTSETMPGMTPGTTPGTTEPRRLPYRVLTGPDDSSFCERVSQALADGYQLHGGPALTFDGERVIVAQAVVLTRTTTGTIQEA